MDTDKFSNWLSRIDGISIVKTEKDKLYFAISQENLIIKITKTANLSDNFISIHSEEEGILFCIHNTDFNKFVEIWEDKNSYDKSSKKYGIPDLSLVTVNQMMKELKKRENISFAFVMTELSDAQNILLEGSGNPTYICGLLSRGLYIANKFAEKDLNFDKS